MVESVRKSRRKWFWAVAAVSAAIVAIILLALSAIRAARTAPCAPRCGHLQMIGFGFLHFDDVYQRLPPAVRTDELGRPLSSWRFQLAGFLEYSLMLDWDYDKAWDDPENRHLSDIPHQRFCCDRQGVERTNTNVVVITGPGTPFDGERICRLTDIDSDTILAIDVADFDRHWMEPGDLSLDEVPETITEGLDGEGVHVLFADGSVWYLRPDVPLGDLRKFFTIDGARAYDREQVLGPFVVHKTGKP
jgi:prepilin-type processing-associated H-X9-DG protein